MSADSATPRRFDIALSFPGEHRDYVKEVAAHLASTFTEERVLYDKYHDAEFARPDLNTYLPALYHKDSELIVIFLCPEYAAKHWCKLEWRHINQLIATADAKRIMFLSFGNPGDLSDIGILGGDGYIDILTLPAQTAAEKVLKRLAINNGVSAKPKLAAIIPNDISRIIKYAPAELIGRDAETKLLNDAWNQAVNNEPKRPHVLTFVALGGEGKTSLVAKWTAKLAHDDWQGCEAVFAWSFYSQGTKDQTAASSDLFLKEALVFFGDAEMANSPRHASDKGKRLAQLVGAKRALLILDGVEPLQYAPTSPTPGELKDHGLTALLKGLAASSLGLCVVTSRHSIPDLKAYWQTTAPEIKLLRLSSEAGVALLKSLGVHGNQNEFEKLVEDVQGHALTLNLLGSYLHAAHGGDIRKRDLVKLEDANEEQGGHAFRVMDAYVQWFQSGGKNADENKKGQRALAVLRLMGLFDRPMSADCFYALLKAPTIPKLTELLVEKNEAKRNMALTRLENAKLLTINRDASGTLLSLDAHPLLREYFAQQIREQHLGTWREANRRLYKYLCAATKEGELPTLEKLQPLYQAVAHGCLADMQQEACFKVYRDRILRGTDNNGFYSAKKLGAFGSDLGAIACFFEQPWNIASPAFNEFDQSWLLNEAAIRLRALGRLNEAVEPMRASLEKCAQQTDWKEVSIRAANLSELKLTMGKLNEAIANAEQSVTYADRSGDTGMRMVMRTTHADALHQAGRQDEAKVLFHESEKMQAERQPRYPLLYSLQGFQYCDLLLAVYEHAAWLVTMGCGDSPNTKALSDISQRAAQFLQWKEEMLEAPILDFALHYLTLSRATFYKSILDGSSVDVCRISLQQAVDGLRSSNEMTYIPNGLLTRAWLHTLKNHLDAAQADLDEALEIAERGPMPLHMADIYLHRARLFFRVTPYPWHDPDCTPRSAKDDLAEARRLIEKHGYWRRKEELEDAEQVIVGAA